MKMPANIHDLRKHGKSFFLDQSGRFLAGGWAEP
jgi:hypothetical protein